MVRVFIRNGHEVILNFHPKHIVIETYLLAKHYDELHKKLYYHAYSQNEKHPTV